MKLFSSRVRLLGVSLLLMAGSCVRAQPPAVPAPAGTNPDTATTVRPNQLDATTFASWVDGKETPIRSADSSGKDNNPAWVVWTSNGYPGFSGVQYGDSSNPGPRYLRIGFTTPVTVGTVFTRGGGSLSVLKPGAAYPGQLNDDSEWLPAQRLVNGVPSIQEAGPDDYGVWVLPPGTQTTAFRFTHVAVASDNKYGGWVGNVFVTADRFVNLAPQALVTTTASTQHAALINDGSDDGGWGAWDNGSNGQDGGAVAPGHGPTITLVWPQPVKLSGLDAMWAGFSAADVQYYDGPANVHPRDADESAWKSAGSYSGLVNGYPIAMWPNRLDFAAPVTTRAIRFQITAPTRESHPHLSGKTNGGRRVWLGELMALENLGDAPIAPVVFAQPPADTLPHPPIPVRFNLKQAGYVTLVIEDAKGVRVRNLVSETYFPAGANTAWWDGTDDLGRDVDAANHGLYHVPGAFVAPGTYSVRGLYRGALGLHYEFPIYTAGNPAWNTVDHTGGWLANHSAPMAALFVPAAKSPAGQDTMLIGSIVSEGTDSLGWLDLQGKKIGGQGWVGGAWGGCPYIAGDTGNAGEANVYAYVASFYEAGLRLTALSTTDKDRDVLHAQWKLPDVTVRKNAAGGQLGGMAVHNGLIAISVVTTNQILFVDAKAGQVTGTMPLQAPGGLAFDAAGKLYAISGSSVVTFEGLTGAEPWPTPKTVISAGLVAPSGITLDGTGNIYVSDDGSSNQVKVFNAGGHLTKTIGHPGLSVAGPYDQLHMNHPDGMAIDPSGHLWVTENDHLPKRVSVWTPDGQLWKAFYGPSKYGGGGTLENGDSSKFLYADEGNGTLEFHLDWPSGTFQLTNILYRPTPDSMPLAFRSAAPETVYTYKGTRYFTDCFNNNPTDASDTAFLFIEKNGVAQPVAAAGRVTEWPTLLGDDFKALWPGGTVPSRDRGDNDAFFIWSDKNGDGKVQPDEVSMVAGSSGGITFMPDLSIGVSILNSQALQFIPASFSPTGAPLYDIAHGKVLADKVMRAVSDGGNMVLTTPDGYTILGQSQAPFPNYSLTGDKNGVPAWSYPTMWPGLHPSHESAKPDRPGELIGTTRLLGGMFTVPGTDVGPLWAINSNMGCIYVFTADGLFVATLFHDSRQGQLWELPHAVRNMSLDALTLHDENFWPTITETPEGKTYLVDGGRSSLIRVDGMDTIRAIPAQPLVVSNADLKAAQTYQINAEALRQANEGRGRLQVTLLANPPTVDGSLDDWANANWVEIDKSGAGANFNSNSKPYDITAAVNVSGDKLYAAFRTGDPNLLDNTGEDPNAPFKTGGALDIMLGTDPAAKPGRANPVPGDIRFLVTKVKGKTLALIYRAVVPGTTNPVPFSSPWRTITLDKVDDVSDQIELAHHNGDYELSVPLAALGLTPKAGLTLTGDIGILRGQDGVTLSRDYWNNKATGITADVPSEAMLTPSLWGSWVFNAEN